jgi:hypothetical protein
MGALVLALIIVAAVLAGIELIRSGGTSLVCWAVEALAVALLVPTLAGALGRCRGRFEPAV